jgi:hypothetical protein
MTNTTKTEQMLVALRAGNAKGALRVAQTFRAGFTPEQRKIIGTAYECLVHPNTYRQLGKVCTKHAQLCRPWPEAES